MDNRSNNNKGQKGRQRPNGGRNNNSRPQNQRSNNPQSKQMSTSRGEAIRAQRRNSEMATKLASGHLDAENKPLEHRANVISDDKNKLRVTFLGGQDGIGEKNMQVVEFGDDALILDCGFNLGLELPGVNYSIPDTAYLEQIKHKIRGYVISHGHLDHIGALKHIVPKYPAPIYGSRYSIGVIEQSFENAAADTGLEYKPSTVIMNLDNHEKLKLGVFFIELVRITHSIPESNCIVVDTPVGKIINTGDFRLDPEPLDAMPSDIDRLKQLGDEGVLLLMSESTYSNVEGRTLTEHTLQQNFHDVINNASGRVFVAIFSSNMNRVQMIVNAAVAAGRRVALDGRSMMSYAEIAVRQGLLKIPKGFVLPMREMPNIPDNQVLVILTGGQGEPGSALQRMSIGEHKHIKIKEGDTVVVSSNPIPGNELSYQQIGNDIVRLGAFYYSNKDHDVYNTGLLHVGGHGYRGEHRDMIRYIKPKFMIPIYAGPHNRKLHFDLAIEEGIPRNNTFMAENGDSFHLTQEKCEYIGQVPHGSVLVDQSGNPVSNVVVKDRIMLSESGLVAVILTVDRKSGQLLTSPDIVTRGFIYIRDNEELMTRFRAELRRAVLQRFKRIDLDRFKAEIKDHVTHFLYDETGRTPIVIPVVNVVGGKTEQQNAQNGNGKQVAKSEEEQKADQQKRFQEMRAKLLGADQPD
ncbi:ribonuclease J [Candidatus Saccharibacteria bacterium]|nr:ribonuclease J [Candidatus Saccharibacteria bacterium]